MKLNISDPLSLLPFQSGLVDSPLEEKAAQGNTSLDVRQRSLIVGEPVPIVFCRRLSNEGGVLVAPGASEGRFENNSTSNQLTVKLMLVLSEGQFDAIKLKDVFQRSCRVGTWNQSYDRRAQSWVPGTNITTVANKTAWRTPSYCGTSGRYENMTTLSYTNTHEDADTTWDRQIYVMCRDGMKVTRILDDTLGPSNNFIDLAIYLIKQSKRLPDSLIDNTSMLAAATFTNANGLLFNGVFDESTNLEDWLTTVGNNFLLRLTTINGKIAFKSRLPTNANGTIKITSITPVFTFTEDHIIPGSFQISYIPISERKNAAIHVLYRQQPDDDLGLIRTAEIKVDGEAATGPFEQHDMSKYCASELGAVRVGAFKVARRKSITHNLRVSVRPSVFNATLVLGDIVRVRLRRESNTGVVSSHDYMYEVERIDRNVSGLITLDLTHFPIDNQKRSIVALLTNAATAPGSTIPTGRTDFTCDTGSRRTDDTTALADLGMDYSAVLASSDFSVPTSANVTSTLTPATTLATATSDISSTLDGQSFDTTSIDVGAYGGGYSINADSLGPVSNASDPLDAAISTSFTDNRSTDRPLRVGDTVTSQGPACTNGRILYYRGKYQLLGSPLADPAARKFEPVWETTPFKIDNSATVGSTGVSSWVISTSDDIIGHGIKTVRECPDESSPTGFGTPELIGETDPEEALEPNPANYKYARWVGTKSISQNGAPTTTEDVTTDWMEYNTYDGSGNLTAEGWLRVNAAARYAGGSFSSWIGDTSGDGDNYSYPTNKEWNSTVKLTTREAVNLIQANIELGGISSNTGGGSNQPKITHIGSANAGSFWEISGKWEFSNTTSGTKVVDQTWDGRTATQSEL